MVSSRGKGRATGLPGKMDAGSVFQPFVQFLPPLALPPIEGKPWYVRVSADEKARRRAAGKRAKAARKRQRR